MMETLSADICVIGGGSGGLSVASIAAAFGVSVVLVERGRMGGDCLNYGCVPSKALIAAARHVKTIADAAQFGIDVAPPTVDYARVRQHIQSVIAQIAPIDSVERFTALGARVIRADARFVDRRTVEAGNVRIKARRFVIATGSSPLVPSIPGLDTVEYLTNETIFDLKVLPAHLVILGGGPAGLELAQAFHRLGAPVTVIEAGRALSREDPELSAIALKRLRQEGVVLHEGVAVTSVDRADDGIRLSCEGFEGAFSLDASHVLLATGRSANVEGLGLAEAGVKLARRGIDVNRSLRTSNRRIYAIGDVAGGVQLTHAANYHAKIVTSQILLRLPMREKRERIPRVTFIDPEIAHVGLSEEEARARYGDIHILRWPYAENDRAHADRKTDGLIKVIADRKARVLGAAIVGEGAGEMINMWSLAISKRLTLKDVRSYVAPYPTLSEIGKRAAISYYVSLARSPRIRSIIRFLGRFG